MVTTTSFHVSQLIRRLRKEAGLTQRELAERVGTTQSVISRLESDDYEGHSLSMLYRIGAALDRRIAVTAVNKKDAGVSVHEAVSLPAHDVVSVHEKAPAYERSPPRAAGSEDGLSAAELERLVERMVRRFGDRGVRGADIEEAIRWARRTGPGDAAPGRRLDGLRGVVEVGRGDVADDVRRARAQRGRQKAGP